MKDTRRQHHVWRSYLEAWATEKIVFCLQDGRIFPSNVSGVAVERDFHKLKSITKADVEGIRWLVGKAHPAAKPVHENFLTSFGVLGWLQANPPPHLVGNAQFEALLRHEIINAEEKWHAALERDMVPIIASLRRRDARFYTDDGQSGQFLYFLCLQNLRTKGVRDRVAARTTEVNGFSVARCWNILRHILAATAGANLYLERKQRPLLVLENDTGWPFITGDQPVVNLLSSRHPDKPPELLAFYYPVSPSTAIILDEVEPRCGYASGPVSAEQVAALNCKIRDASHSQVFGSSREVLESVS
jgi:hypothetical protein